MNGSPEKTVNVVFLLSGQPNVNSSRVNFTTLHDFMVIVPVAVNEAGPFDFLLDTGATDTVVDQALADQLSLPRVGEQEVTTTQSKLHFPKAHSDSISVAGAKVHDLDISILSRNNVVPSKVHGILGEDFLSNFDLFIDYRHHVVELQSGDGPLTGMFGGERLPIAPVAGRLILSGYARELGGRDISLLLDSGVNFLILFGGQQSLGDEATPQNLDIAGPLQIAKGASVYRRTIQQLRFGKTIVRNVTAFAPPTRPGMDTDGLMPTSAFGSIFISHSQKFVILDPIIRGNRVARK